MSFVHKHVVNLYIYYELDTWSNDLNTDFLLGNCLLGAVKLSWNVDPDKYRYSGHGIGFDACSDVDWSDGYKGKNLIIFGAGLSSSTHIDDKNKYILVLGE